MIFLYSFFSFEKRFLIKIPASRQDKPTMEHPSMISSPISFLYMIKIAINVPKCNRISNKIPVSVLIPKIFLKIARCPELLTGRNSVAPCMIPIMIDSNKVIVLSLQIPFTLPFYYYSQNLSSHISTEKLYQFLPLCR